MIAWLKKQRVEWWVWALFVVCVYAVMCVHEPWFDEQQSWQIAKTASWYDMLFVLPHYEGHPPFWHILLALPARLGISWQIGLRTVGLLFSSCAAWLLIFKSPFPRWFRCLVPFTFFLFYQYSVIVRPYSIMMLLLFLLAIVFPDKDKKPGLFVGLLAGLCACHVYGIAIAGGIACAWLLELKGNAMLVAFCKKLLHQKQFYYLLGLLIWACILVAWIRPYPDTFASHLEALSPLWRRFLYVLFILPSDAVITSVLKEVTLQQASLDGLGFFVASGMGVILWVEIFYLLPRKYWGYLALPYIFLAVLFFSYSSRHHIGLWLLLVLFVGWIGWRDKITPKRKIAQILNFETMVVCLLASCIWTLSSVYWDSRTEIFPAKQTLSFLQKKNLLENRVIMAWWEIDERNISQTNMVAYGTELSFYVGKNILTNFNMNSTKEYRVHQLQTLSESYKTLQAWKKKGMPDVLIGGGCLECVFEGENLIDQYMPAFKIQTYDLWKHYSPRLSGDYIFIRKELS